MNLSPEERKIGKDNFNEAVGTLSRRELLKGAVLAGAGTGVGLGAAYFGYDPKIDDRLRVGIIGTGDEGGVLIGAINPDFIDVVAIADIRPYSIHRAFYGDWYSAGAHAARPGLLDVYKREGWVDDQAARSHIDVYTDRYDRLLDDPNVEAVMIALPLHLHHEAAVAAMRAGKHVLTEKLMAHNVAQCKDMARVAQETGMILAVGHQRHYSILYDNAVDQIRQGLIGAIHHIRAQWHRANLPGSDSWQPKLPGDNRLENELKSWESVRDGTHPKVPKPTKAGEIAEWNRKIEQKRAQINDISNELAEKYGYQSELLEIGYNRSALEELIRWRLWNRTGGGLMAELGSHQLDAASIFISAQRKDGRKVKPLSVSGIGGRHIFPADRECEDHVYCTFEFPGSGYFKGEDTYEVADPNKKIGVTYSSINGNGFGGYGEVVFGTEGTLILERDQDAMLFKGSNTTTRVSVKAADGKAAMDTYETGGGAAAAIAQAATPVDVSRGYREEIEHWAWCIRNPDPTHQPRCTPDVALADAVIALTSNLAIAKGGRIDFDPEWFEIGSDKTPDGSKPQDSSNLT